MLPSLRPITEKGTSAGFAKITAIWNKQQNRSTLSAEKIKDALVTLLQTPGDTRWNSYV